MLGCYDFCGHYDWTFDWLEKEGGEALLHRYWDTAIHGDSQQHAAQLIMAKGLEGMKEYWGHTLADEAPGGGYSTKIVEDRFIAEMTDCPSRGFLLRNGIEFSKDYCDHCIGWIGPLMKKAGHTVHHAHNHCGQCYWEFRPEEKKDKALPSLEKWKKDLVSEWQNSKATIDFFDGLQSAARKRRDSSSADGVHS